MTTKSLKTRLDEATTSPSKWNFWPDQLEIIKIERFDLKNPRQAYKAGKLFGHYDDYRQIIPTNAPEAIQVMIHTHHPLLTTHFTYAHPRGQGDDIETRNVFAMFERYPATGTTWEPCELIVAELGCHHDYDTTGSRMCYTTGKCRKCGHSFVCDSSD